MRYKQGRYSGYLKPFLILFDLSIVNLFAFYFFDFNQDKLYFFSSEILNNKHILFVVYSSFFWVLTAFFLKFYNVYRFTSFLNLISLLVKQFCAFTLIVFSFIGIFRSINIYVFDILKFTFICIVIVGLVKVMSYYAQKKYRLWLNGNTRKIVVIGTNEGSEKFKKLINQRKDLGYDIKATFSNYNLEKVTGDLKDGLKYIQEQKNIDEIYCAIDELNENQANEYVKVASLNQKNIKFIPEDYSLFTKKLQTEYYNYIPILSVQEVSLNTDVNAFFKRFFDIIFSIIVIVFILSWVTPIMFILIKLDSKGPLFYKHERNGLNYKVFSCYKFRTLKLNTGSKIDYVKKEDSRVTKIGRVLRTLSLDELPQFINILLGDMSVVGPRPHMLSYTKKYAQVIDKYSFIYRHSVKPGLTGLAQIKGYRGEITSKEDIINRIKYDIFYIENWSMLLDLKIIAQTIINIFKGEEKAY
ncbi:exopolysaccharide biosynthesis polyprenyl glycosylphosphotransferase [Flavobacteriaceae bacterium S0825]|uniref:exopolysaccharide biosynthesis polyprenyl glycosylphosphotransferase n=1 Tax=Gaetbulibacter sp. S0825 TaxID=2720084 RepID=UPI00142FEDF0|nr:exopolysaccharide biosynthesis polyprenyl glycosylphosphotransferase [Gaetbulibacter sp. S0825]MCK0108301.1 exopolysaccharide biosynthesis polyprenyl glycosylphosphotransferase [Flavobacteriaceae bacterium S0825]NIX63937.1 exopolysaccharide biosynthesis polyprenyl glycosylphosphotransferase [Gaetbulibacter sp. S0825]